MKDVGVVSEKRNDWRTFYYGFFKTGQSARASSYEYDILVEHDGIQEKGGDVSNETGEGLERYGVSR